ncbi:SDR family NAD(P)-dependent oxidoreductase [Paenibacillus sacheonensis]|uniref:SDR family oxidoreductase n=1 Tax=Paenibacillus sacheonensis TaxID=742054 RepID=A0A7X4YKX5_9BACL|nr:SDR family oxidoreductase [Paenibacillus sacheonensis]MBM7563133.1 NAD(P)-dependent dehydrogenase (short-subunit alcohol dehydrogenase family) [Paenibacillus sacheonensis]NBC68303.1 SDR family oxidoreductase [Paenibacillus sacheonensis]
MAVDQQYVMITGAGAGIGREVAWAYASKGATVILTDKNAESLAQTTERLRSGGQRVFSQVLDVSDPAAIAACFAWVRESAGRLDALINNAGLGAWKSPYDLEVDEWDYVLNTNLRGTFLCAREAAKLMRASGGGAIVNLASTRALMSEPNSEAYAASKGGIVALTHALAVSLGPDLIRVNAISPGWIETGDYGALRPIDHAQHPAQRVGNPDDIARACFYLTDPANDFVTGTNLVIDGGMTRKMMYEE